jgi:hypothetical protein
MKYLRRILAMTPLLFMLGCTGTTMIGHTAQYAVSEYCLLPSLGRSILRDELDTVLSPNSIEIVCLNN